MKHSFEKAVKENLIMSTRLTSYGSTRSYTRMSLLRFAYILVAVLSMLSPVWAHDYKTGELEIKHPIMAATPPGATVAAGYISINNDGDSDDRLLDVSASFAGAVGVHQTEIDAEVARMRPLKEGVLLPAKSTVSLTPGHMHLMFENLSEQLVLGELYDVTLVFEQAGERTVQFWVQDISEQEFEQEFEHEEHENAKHKQEEGEHEEHEPTEHEHTDQDPEK